MKDFLKKNSDIIFTCIFVIIVALLGSIFVSLGKDWFASLLKPSQWLPDFVISLLWTVIYILFAVIISVLFKKELITKKIIVFAVLNGILNVLWCLVFFTLNLLFLGNIVIIINVFFAVLLIAELVKTNKIYVNILWIYPIWIFIATSLNTALWILN